MSCIKINAQIIYVDINATGTNNGSSWTNAFNDLNNALGNANEGDSIWVAEGTYKPTSGTNRSIFFQVPYGVKLFGNFAGNEGSLNQRGNIAPDSSGTNRLNETILSGDIGVINDSIDNSYHVVYPITKSGVGSNFHIDGFKVVNGYADDSYHNFGAGIYCGTATPNETSYLKITNCIVSNNYAATNGAGVESFSHYSNSYLTINNSTIRNNYTSDGYSKGAAVTCFSAQAESQVRVENCFIIHNSTIGDGAGIFSETYSTSNLSIITVIKSTINHNSALGGGGGILSASINSSSIVRLINSNISNNKAGDGGAVVNTAGGNTYTTTYSSLLSNNFSSIEGGAIITGAYSVGFNSKSFINIFHSTIADNNATSGGGGIYPLQNDCDVTIDNSIIYNNKYGVQESNIEYKNPVNIDTKIDYSLVENYSSILGYIGNNNLNTNPLFSNPATNDYTLQAISPAINQGDTSLLSNDSYDIDNDGVYNEKWPIDLTGIRRVYGSNIDMGAYEEYCSISSNLSDTACDIYIAPSGASFTSSGIYIDTLLSSTNCDSLINISLYIKNSSNSTINDTLTCGSTFTAPSGNTIAYNGPYTDTISNTTGCDSIITINLYGGKSYCTDSLISCDSINSPSGNYTWYSSGLYSDTLINNNGCDSIIDFNLTINQSSSNSFSVNACNSYTPPSGNYTWVNSGMYLDTIPNFSGCDSLLTINLSITSVDTSIADTLINPTGTVLTSNALGAAYQWLDCSTGLFISGETNQSIIPTPGNTYAVQITYNGCIDTSSCFYVLPTSIFSNKLENKLVTYPNPTNGKVTFYQEGINKNITIQVKNTIGQIISSNEYYIKNSININLPENSGIYFIEIKSFNEIPSIFKILKK